MSNNDWWNDLYDERQTTAEKSPVTTAPEPAGPTVVRKAFLPSPVHAWGSGRPADPFLTQNPAHGTQGDNTPEEAAELERHRKTSGPEEPQEEKTESTPAPAIPPMPTRAPDTAVPQQENTHQTPKGIRELLKVFKESKTKAAENGTKSVQEAMVQAAKTRDTAVTEAKKARESAESFLAGAQHNVDRLTREGSGATPQEIKAARKVLREARRTHSSAVRTENRVAKEAAQTEKATVKEAQKAADEARKEDVKAAWKETKEGVVNTIAPPDSNVRTVATSVSSTVTGSSGFSYLWSLAAAWTIPLTFPFALLDRIALLFGSPRPLTGTERMDWNLLHGPGLWFEDQINAYSASGDIGRMVTLMAIGVAPVAFAQTAHLITRDRLRKALGWIAYGFPAFFIAMPSYFDWAGFRTTNDFYITALAAAAWWGFTFSRTIQPGLMRIVLRIPLAAVIVGLGHTAPGAAF